MGTLNGRAKRALVWIAECSGWLTFVDGRIVTSFLTPEFSSLPLLLAPNKPISFYRKLKRVVDFIVSASLFVLLSPVFFLVAIAIKLDSRGPIFLRQERVGEGGRVFKMLRFRTMSPQAEVAVGPVWAMDRDPRITRLGRLLRRTSLDELPQFWNVLKGEMSLVGPRPDRPYEAQVLAEKLAYYAERYSIKPGITGWAQVHHPLDAIGDVGSRLRYDLFYVSNTSFRLDLKIFLRTVRITLPVPTLQESDWDRLQKLLVKRSRFHTLHHGTIPVQNPP